MTTSPNDPDRLGAGVPRWQGTPAGPTRPPPPRRRHPGHPRRLSLVVAIGLVLLSAAVWGVVVLVQHQQASQAAADRADAVAKCHRQIGDFVEALRDIDSRLDVGMTQRDLMDAAADAAAERNDVDESALSDACDSTYDRAESALQIYAATAMEWNDCIFSDDWCDPDDPDDLDLQTPWSHASDALDEAYDAMRSGHPVGSSSS